MAYNKHLINLSSFLYLLKSYFISVYELAEHKSSVLQPEMAHSQSSKLQPSRNGQ